MPLSEDGLSNMFKILHFPEHDVKSIRGHGVTDATSLGVIMGCWPEWGVGVSLRAEKLCNFIVSVLDKRGNFHRESMMLAAANFCPEKDKSQIENFLRAQIKSLQVGMKSAQDPEAQAINAEAIGLLEEIVNPTPEKYIDPCLSLVYNALKLNKRTRNMLFRNNVTNYQTLRSTVLYFLSPDNRKGLQRHCYALLSHLINYLESLNVGDPLLFFNMHGWRSFQRTSAIQNEGSLYPISAYSGECYQLGQLRIIDLDDKVTMHEEGVVLVAFIIS